MKPFNPGAWDVDGAEVEVKVTVGDVLVTQFLMALLLTSWSKAA